VVVERLPSGRTVGVLSDEDSINSGIIRRWRREHEVKLGDFPRSASYPPEELKLKSLKKELRAVKMERDLLKKALCICSKSDQ